MNLNTVSITDQTRLTEHAFLLKLPKLYPFKPGQSVAITLDNSFPPRLYSICSGNDQDTISVMYKVVADGKLTPKLSKLQRGDSILVSEPMGSFIHDAHQGFWIASGTGIAPYISMLESGVIKPVKLLYGTGTGTDIYFCDYLKKELGSAFVPCVTREKLSGVYYGRITKWLQETQELPLNLKYYLCGSPEMVVDTRDILIEKGVEFRNITSEIYF